MDTLDHWSHVIISSYCDFATKIKLNKVTKKLRFNNGAILLDHPVHHVRSINNVLRMKPNAVYEFGVYNDISQLMKFAETKGEIDYITAFGIACYGGVISQMDYLMLMGIIDPVRGLIFTTQSRGWINAWNTGLHYACRSGRLDVVKIIVAESNGKYDIGKSLCRACENHHTDIVKYLASLSTKHVFCSHCRMYVKPTGEHYKKVSYYDADED
jgi:hypothetical protein